MSFTITTTTLSDRPLIALVGDADVYNAPKLKAELMEQLEAGQSHIVVDLEGVNYLDATTLGVLIGGLKRCRERDGNLELICPIPRIRRVFEITGLDRIFDLHTSRKDWQKAREVAV